MKLPKTILKPGYYYEFKDFYKDLPDELEVPEDYFYKKLTKNTSEGDMLKQGTPFTKLQAFGLACKLAKEKKKGWNLIFFTDDNGISCKFYAVLRAGGKFYLGVDEVHESGEWRAEDGFFLSNSNSEPLPTDTHILGNFESRIASLEETVEKLTKIINI